MLDRRNLLRHVISEQTFYRWNSRFDGLNVSDAQRLRQVEFEKLAG